MKCKKSEFIRQFVRVFMGLSTMLLATVSIILIISIKVYNQYPEWVQHSMENTFKSGILLFFVSGGTAVVGYFVESKERSATEMVCITLIFTTPEEREVFKHAIEDISIAHKQRRNHDMARPYDDIANDLLGRGSIELFGGFLECAKFALANSDTAKAHPDTCSTLLKRINKLIAEQPNDPDRYF